MAFAFDYGRSVICSKPSLEGKVTMLYIWSNGFDWQFEVQRAIADGHEICFRVSRVFFPFLRTFSVDVDFSGGIIDLVTLSHELPLLFSMVEHDNMIRCRCIQYPCLPEPRRIRGTKVLDMYFIHPGFSTPPVMVQLHSPLQTTKLVTGVTPTCWRPPYGDVDVRTTSPKPLRYLLSHANHRTVHIFFGLPPTPPPLHIHYDSFVLDLAIPNTPQSVTSPWRYIMLHLFLLYVPSVVYRDDLGFLDHNSDFAIRLVCAIRSLDNVEYYFGTECTRAAII